MWVGKGEEGREEAKELRGIGDVYFFLFRRETAYDVRLNLVDSEMRIRDRSNAAQCNAMQRSATQRNATQRNATQRKAEQSRADHVPYTHLRAHETKANRVCRLLLEKKNYVTIFS